MIANEEMIYTFQLSRSELESINRFMQDILNTDPMKMESDVLLFCRGVNELAAEEG